MRNWGLNRRRGIPGASPACTMSCGGSRSRPARIWPAGSVCLRGAWRPGCYASALGCIVGWISEWLASPSVGPAFRARASNSLRPRRIPTGHSTQSGLGLVAGPHQVGVWVSESGWVWAATTLLPGWADSHPTLTGEGGPRLVAGEFLTVSVKFRVVLPLMTRWGCGWMGGFSKVGGFWSRKNMVLVPMCDELGG